MSNDIPIKKIEESIDYLIKKKNFNINLEPLNQYIISKFNNTVVSADEIQTLENIILVNKKQISKN